ncbi:MAG TPA: HRDC domain-containing protein [Aggregatilineaceae bacterium]|nr:HRDC domain-containing protein [Aggregatilineaceae bacterium]
MKSELKPADYIRRTTELRRLVDRIRHQSLLAVDTESNSLFAYYERVCLVQLSTREQDFIVDPLALDNMNPLGELLADPAVEIVFHAAEYDIITLKRDFKFTFSHVFDTMLAARICGWEKVGLGSILAEQFDILVDKKYQRADWSERPLPPSLLLYAQMDTHYLPDLRDRLVSELEKAGRLDEAREIFADLPNLSPAEHHFDPEGFWRIGQIQDLKRNQLALVRELYLLRDELARRRNTPPFKVFSDQVIIELARIAPRRLEDLYPIKGLAASLVRSYGDQLIQAIGRGRVAPVPRPPRLRQPIDPEVQLRYEALHEWRKARAVERGVESDVIIPRGTLWALARRVPKTLEELENIPGLGPWRRAEYGAELLALLHKP